MYNWNWDAESIKYLGVSLPRDFTRLYNINYGPLNSKIKADIQRWNLIPFLSLSSRIESIGMNILPRMLYLFQCLPVKIPSKQFLEWDRLIARYLWQGKRARIKFKTLQLRKEKWNGSSLLAGILSCSPIKALNHCSMKRHRRNDDKGNLNNSPTK